MNGQRTTPWKPVGLFLLCYDSRKDSSLLATRADLTCTHNVRFCRRLDRFRRPCHLCSFSTRPLVPLREPPFHDTATFLPPQHSPALLRLANHPRSTRTSGGLHRYPLTATSRSRTTAANRRFLNQPLCPRLGPCGPNIADRHRLSRPSWPMRS